MNHAKNKSLWSIAMGREKVGDYSSIETFKKPHLSEFPSKKDVYMTEADNIILKNFLSKKHQTIGELLTINNIEGSSIMASIEKLMSLGMIKRDWEKEEEMHTDVIYSLTYEGGYIAQNKLSI